MIKNTAGQKIGAQMVSASDGSAFTSTVTVYVTIDAGTQAIGSVGSGVCTHEGNGLHTYAPAQAETNGDHLAFTFIGTGAIPATVQVFPLPGALPTAAALQVVDDNVDAILVDTGTTLQAELDGIQADTEDIQAKIGTPAVSLAADIAAIEAQTDDIGTAGAGLTNIPWNAAWDAEVQSEVADALAVYDPPTNTEMEARTLAAASYATASAVSTVQTTVDDIPTNAELAAVEANLSADIAGVPADTIDEVVEGTVTVRQSLRLSNAASAGKLSGAASTTVAIRDLSDTKNRISATVDADGNRTAVTRDVT